MRIKIYVKLIKQSILAVKVMKSTLIIRSSEVK
jgi:hypothetical protein